MPPSRTGFVLQTDLLDEPRIALDAAGEDVHVALFGSWTADRAPAVEACAADLAGSAAAARRVLVDMRQLDRLDTLGAFVLDRVRRELAARGQPLAFAGARAEHAILLEEIAAHRAEPLPARRRERVTEFLEDVGRNVVSAGRDFAGGVSFLGEVVVAFGRILARPARFRAASVIHQLEAVAFRGVPIIALISFLVGCIVAQQGIFQLQRFGAATFVVDLVGLLILRELAVLLTSIMVAGRSGSAFTAEIGSMKMREEIDALRVMGLDPVEVLIVPRLLALVIGLPLLTFLSMMASLFGAGLTAWIYGDISPDVFLSRLRGVITTSHFMVGVVKAPFMALVIGVIACIEGLAVAGSAESLGRHVTSSVVKAIFMVIVLDGVFAIFFAAIRY